MGKGFKKESKHVSSWSRMEEEIQWLSTTMYLNVPKIGGKTEKHRLSRMDNRNNWLQEEWKVEDCSQTLNEVLCL